MTAFSAIPAGVPRAIPTPDGKVGLLGLRAILRERHPLAAMAVFREQLGDVFQITLPGFRPVVMAGPDAARFVLVEGRHDLRWRNEADPVTALLGHGVLVEDGEAHDALRELMNPTVHRTMIERYVGAMADQADRVIDRWADGATVDMLDEMRRAALLILMDTLYEVDYSPHVEPLWEPILKLIRYISPGVWMFWGGVPRPQFNSAIRKMDAYLYAIIAARRESLSTATGDPSDLIGVLINGGLEDKLIRDQLLTMLIAGHDTSTALLAWSLALLGQHPEAMAHARAEADRVLDDGPVTMAQVNQLEYIGQVAKEALRLYPPIHLGSRVAAVDLAYDGYRIPAGTRVIYSIYLNQRHPDYWPDPARFDPARHAPGRRPAPYSWLAFGGGPRNCIGAAYGLIEAKIVLGRMLQRVDLELAEPHIHPHMGATLEPRPGVRMRVRHR